VGGHANAGHMTWHRYLALAIACCWIAAAPILIRLSEVGPAPTLWLRMLIAACVLAAMPKVTQAASARARGGLLAASLAFAIDITAFHLATMRTSVASLTVLAQISPLVVAPISYFTFAERQSVGSVLALLAAFAGVILLAGVGGYADFGGNALAILSGISYAAYLVIAKGLAQSVAPRRMMLWNCVVTMLAVTPLVLERGGPYLPHSAQGWLVIVAMAFGCQLLGHGLVVYAIESLPVSFTSQALLTPPVLSGAAALLLFGELPSLSQLAGAALVLTGLCLGARHASRGSNG
jgi:drug/metabolite transporter (DMT)-like permease